MYSHGRDGTPQGRWREGSGRRVLGERLDAHQARPAMPAAPGRAVPSGCCRPAALAVLLGWPVFPIQAAPRALPALQGGSNAIRANPSESP